jgi:hypothetical protein
MPLMLTDLFGGKEKMSTFAIPFEKRVSERAEFLRILTLKRSLKNFLKKVSKKFGD